MVLTDGETKPKWKVLKEQTDKYLPQIKRILGENFIGEPPISEDLEHNTDLIVLNMTGLRFGCRLRNEKYFKAYPDEFTIRCSVQSGNKTELAKIIEGWGDYFFYGFMNENEVFSWKIGDLKVFRLYFNGEIVKRQGLLPGVRKLNYDKSSAFIAFKWNDLPKGFVFSSSGTQSQSNRKLSQVPSPHSESIYSLHSRVWKPD